MSKENAVQVIEKNPGEKIAWEQSGTRLFFGDDELMLNVAKYQKDWHVQVDICADENSNLVIGTGTGRYYVAQVDIPAIKYEEVEDEAEEASESENEDEENTQQTPAKQMIPLPLDMADVILTLWSVDDLKTNK